MCDVEQRIEKWRNDLRASEALSSADVDELEAHLREEIDCLRGLDLSETEAFLVARHRLGDTPALDNEFAKVHGSRRALQRLSWMAVGVLVYLLAGYIASGFSQGGVLAATLLGVRGYTLGILGVSLKTAAVVGSFVLAWLLLQQCDWTKPIRRLQAISVARLVLLLVVLLLADGVLIGSQVLFRIVMVRSLGRVDYGRMALVWGYAGLAWTILAPLIAAGLVIALRLCAERRSETGLAGPSGE